MSQSELGLRPAARNREDITNRYKWDPSHIFATWEDWEAALTEISPLADKLVTMKGRLRESPATLVEALELADKIGMAFSKVGAFAHLHYDSDQRDNGVNGRRQRVLILGSKVATALSWFTPELLTIPRKQMDEWLATTPELEPHRFGILEAYRQQEHFLDEAGEKLLSYGSRLRQAPSQAYEMLSTADARWPEVQLTTGAARLTEPTYAEILHTNRNQADRRKAFEAMMGMYKESINTFAALYDGVCQRDWCSAQSRSFPSALHQALETHNIPLEIYHNLIEATKKGYPTIRRYHSLRKKALGLDTYDLYDGGIPIIEDAKRYPYDSVAQMVIEATTPLGEEYVKRVKQAFSGGWIDVYENNGKRSGAYSMGVYGVHPYMLLNYNDTLDYVFTVAHEMGHTLHSMLSQETQPFATSQYTIFVAEVASTMNEALLMDYLLRRVETPAERIILLENSIDQILGTYFTQVRFADFELEVHNLVESGKPVTAVELDNVFRRQLEETFRDCAELHPLYSHAWARIPHFYRTPYYVYQYATSFAATARLSQDIISTDNENAERRATRQEATERYLTLLKSGGNDHPVEQLRKAGVDLAQTDAVIAVLDLFERRVSALEEALSADGRLG